MPERKFVRNQPCGLEEDRHTEFKQVGALGDVRHQVVEEYAVAFLNSEGGSIFWGIQDDGTVIGIRATQAERDGFRILLANAIRGIEGHPPLTAFEARFHPVYDQGGQAIPEAYVVETPVPQGAADTLYWTARGAVYLRLDGVNQVLGGGQIGAELERRRQLRHTTGGELAPQLAIATGVRRRQASSAAETPELWREPWPRAAKAMREAGEELKPKYGEGPHPAGLISATAARLSGLAANGLSPADYCYNSINRASFSFRYPLFHRLPDGRYTYLGPNAAYSGEVIWEPRGESARPVGEWKDGRLTLWEDPRR